MSIARQAARGVAWNMMLGVSSRMLQLVGTLILTRFIAPDEYGSVIAASITVLTAGAFTSFAFGQHLIAKKGSPQIAFQAMIMHVALGLVAMVAVYLARDPIGRFVEAPDMGRYVLGYAVAHMLERIRYVPERLIMRALRFRTIATVAAIGKVGFTITALALARRWGAYAIVSGALVEASVMFVLYFALAPRAEWLAPTRLRRADCTDLLRYGAPITIAIIADRAATRWDNLIMSSLFDAGVMARYNLAYSLAEMPVLNIAEQIGEVLMPSFSRMDEAQRKRAVVRTPLLMGVLVSPLGVGLGAIATTVVDTFFDARWVTMAPMLAILSIMTVFRPMTWSAIAFVQAIQKTRLVMLSSAMRAVVVLSLVAAGGVFGGPEGACVGAGLGYAIHSVVTIVVCGRTAGFSVPAYLSGVARSLLPSIPMFFAVIAMEHAIRGSVPLPVSLLIQLVTGVVVYIASAFALVRPTVDELIRHGRDAISRRK